jgi:putative membrane protein insertion efficiency factor
MKLIYSFIVIFITIYFANLCYSNIQSSELAFIIANNPIKNDIKEQINPSEHFGYYSIFTSLIRLYQSFISTQDRPVCNFIPSCSQFGIDSIKEFGAIKGIMLTSDRLQRCNGMSVPYYKLDYRSGKFIDPVQNYINLTKKQIQK